MNFDHIPAGKNPPEDIYVAIEIPANSSPVKYEIDKDMGAVMVDRFMTAPMFTRPTTASSPTPWRMTATPWTCWWSPRTRYSPARSSAAARWAS